MKTPIELYNERFVISNIVTASRSKVIFEEIINSNFTKNGFIKINANYNYNYDTNYKFTHVYYIFNNNNNKLIRKVSLTHNRVSNAVKDEFEFESVDLTSLKILVYLTGNFRYIEIELFGDNSLQIRYSGMKLKTGINENNIESNLGKIGTNTSDIASNSGLISTNTSNIASNFKKISDNTSDISDNSGLISTNTSNIASNLKKISDNTSDISTNTSSISSNLEKINDLQNSNIKAFYNLDQIFIYDIEKGDQPVNKDNHFHIFEKEIYYNFVKNSYLEIILKVLTEISNYVLIGFFQILCNFYDQDNNLFYTISLSTAMGSINRLSTIRSVFIVPINENMSKAKIDFFIAPKPTQQNRSAKFIIKDINSNKIYVKYYQKTDEMSIKSIENSLNTVNSISTRVDSLEKSLNLKNLFNTLYHDNDIKVSHIFFDKTYTLNAKKNDFLEIYFKLLLKYDNISEAKYVTTNFILYDMSNGQELYSISYRNSDYIGITNIDVFLNNSFLFNFDDDVEKLKIAITFSWTRTGLNITYSSINTNRLIIKHYGN